MKKVMILLFSINLFAVEIIFNKNLLIPYSLKQQFITYWKNRANKNFSKTYNLEAPYLQYLYSEDDYETFFTTAPKFKKIYVKDLRCKDKVCYFTILLTPKHSKDSIYYKDKWIKVDNEYYHRFNDNPLPF